MGRAAYMFKSQTIFFDIKSYATGDTFWPFFFSQHPSLQLKHVDVKKQNVECTCIAFCIVLNVLCWEVGCGNFHEINMWHVHADLPSDWCFNIRTWGWPVSWDQWCQVTQSVLGNRMMLRDVVSGVEWCWLDARQVPQPLYYLSNFKYTFVYYWTLLLFHLQ